MCRVRVLCWQHKEGAALLNRPNAYGNTPLHQVSLLFIPSLNKNFTVHFVPSTPGAESTSFH
jgi:hypothetical protein